MKNYLYFIILLFISVACEKATAPNYNVNGYIQKGPFISNSEVILYELDEMLQPTGQSFRTSTNELGFYSYNNMFLISPFVELVADGVYFNVVAGEISNERIKLSVITKIDTFSHVNINALTNIEFKRIRNLISEEQMSIDKAKDQAQKEVINAFQIDRTLTAFSEQIDISSTSLNSAILLSVTSILQTNQNVFGVSKLMGDISFDIELDGTLDEEKTIKKINEQAEEVPIDKIGLNLTEYLDNFNVSFLIDTSFNSIMQSLKDQEQIDITDNPVLNPSPVAGGSNILDSTFKSFIPDVDYYAEATISETDKIKVIVKQTAGPGQVGFSYVNLKGWDVVYEDDEYWLRTVTLESKPGSTDLNMAFMFYNRGSGTISIFKNEMNEPYDTWDFNWGSNHGSGYLFPNNRPNLGTNLLALPLNTEIPTGFDYIFYMENYASEYNMNFLVEFIDGNVSFIEKTGYNYNFVNDSIPVVNLYGNSISQVVLGIEGTGVFKIYNQRIGMEQQIIVK
jgi:hypothetical protein